SLNPAGRIIESATTACAGAFVSVWAIGWARADSNTRQTTAAESGSLVRNLCAIFNVLLSIIPEYRLGLCSWLLVIGWRFSFLKQPRFSNLLVGVPGSFFNQGCNGKGNRGC